MFELIKFLSPKRGLGANLISILYFTIGLRMDIRFFKHVEYFLTYAWVLVERSKMTKSARC